MSTVTRFPRAAALAAGLVLVSCSDSGADVGTFGGGGTPPVLPLAVDFHLRTDLLFGASQVADALAIDLNGDARADLVETNFNDHQVHVALRDVLGGYTADFVLETSGAAWRLVSGDFNGDGLADIAVVEVDDEFGGVNGVSAFFQDAPGSFASSAASAHLALPLSAVDLDVIPAAGSPLAGASLGDLIVVAETESRRVSVIEWNGSGLELALSVDSSSLGLGKPLTVAAVDVLGDGVYDLVVGEVEVEGGLPDRIVLYPADGAGGFDEPELLSLASIPVLDNAGDVDQNGFDDVGVAELGGGAARLLSFDAAGSVDVEIIAFPTSPSSVVFGDLDADSDVDAVATLLGTQELLVRLGDGLGGFAEPVRYNVGFLPRAVAMAELTDYGVLDLLCATNRDLNLLPGDGQGGFRAAVGYRLGSAPVLVSCDDLDGDLDLDVVTVDVAQRQIGFLENDGAGVLELISEVPFVEPSEVELPGGFAVSDLDGDLLPDVVVALHALGEVHILRNPGSVEFGPAAPEDVYTLIEGLYGVAIADLNGDGTPDLVVSSSLDNTVRILTNDPGDLGHFTQEPPLAVPFSPAAVIAEDLDGDGALDLAFTGTTPANGVGGGLEGVLGVLAGDGQGGFEVTNVLPVDTVSATLHCGDFNEDGLLDLVTGQPALFYTKVWIYLSDGAFGFQAAPLEVGGSPGAAGVADIDRDGHEDLVLPLGEGQLRVAFGDGTGAFPVVEPPGDGRWPVPDGTTHCAFEDVDGDGLADLVMVSPDSPNVWIAHNASVELPNM